MTQYHGEKQATKAAGFTLIELLVAIIMAALIIAPILGLAVNLIQTDRREQAKAASEQELQAAADYITRDLQQAVYIYDQEGLYGQGGIPGIKSQLPTVAGGEPVLVFWKRKLIQKSVPVDATQAASSCPNDCNDAFVYSLVAYYLIKDGGGNTWSNAARIGRFELQDGVRKANGEYLNEDGKVVAKVGKDPGFQFVLDEDIAGETFREKVGNWKRDGNYNMSVTPVEVLVDYIDQSTNSDVPQEQCPADLVPADDEPEWKSVPNVTNYQNYGFYSCVYSSRNTAKVFLRGNAYARTENQDNEYKQQRAAFYPTAKIEVTGTGGLSRDLNVPGS
ncbi:MAG TPA: hypothetical protein DD379_12005 [Cyanobacteria bacterium UBA11162]|nr:hypothetical protein [Cyanobacteria bacterium UBA11162]